MIQHSTTPFAQLITTVATCRAALPRKRGVVLRICVRRVLGALNTPTQLSDPNWQKWDGTRRGLAALLEGASVSTASDAGCHRFTLAATHHAVAFEDAAAASRDVTDIVRQLWSAARATNWNPAA
ncbi:MAG: hypothetical protein BGO50_01455 [Rhodanobacter sp. 67-28]|nr:MAG: hypothetical protein BGO50_01455 [Rhodanobacter sp. 67-28]